MYDLIGVRGAIAAHQFVSADKPLRILVPTEQINAESFELRRVLSSNRLDRLVELLKE